MEDCYREEMSAFKAKTGMQSSMLKHFSYVGACRITFQLPKSVWPFVLMYGKDIYIDIGNFWYARLLEKLVGNNVLPCTNDETKGDVIESLLGWWWLVEHGQVSFKQSFDEETLDILLLLNDYFLHGYIALNWEH